MTFATPMIAAIAAALAVPALLILYFLKLRRRDVEISTTLLWKKAIQDLQANAPFQKLRRNILLILQLLALGAVLFALAQPRFSAAAGEAQRHVILIDRSASMGAMDGAGGAGAGGAAPAGGGGGERSRLEEAKRRAIEFVDALKEPGFDITDPFNFGEARADEAMVIVFDSTAEVVQQFTSDKAALRRAIESITPGDGPTSVVEAVRLARAHAPKRVHADRDGTVKVIEGMTEGEPIVMRVFTDGRIGDAERALPGLQDTVVFDRVGAEGAGNASITALRAERGFENPARLTIFAALQNTESQPRRVDVELLLDGNVAGIRSLTIPGATDPTGLVSGGEGGEAGAGGTAAGGAAEAGAAQSGAPARAALRPGVGSVVFALDRTEGAQVEVRLREPTGGPLTDLLEVDNRAVLSAAPARRTSVALVTRGNLFLASALEGLPLARLTTLTPEEFQSRVDREQTGEFDVAVLDGWLPLIGGQRALPPGRSLVLGAIPAGVGLGTEGEPVRGVTRVIDWSREHPATRFVSFDAVQIGEIPRVTVEAGRDVLVLARTPAGPAVVEVGSPGARAVVTTFEPLKSDWSFDASFVVFVASAVTSLSEAGEAGVSGRMVQPGSILADRLPVGAMNARVRTPDGETFDLAPAPDGRVVFGPVRRAGMYTVSWEGPAGAGDETADGRVQRRFAANLFDPAESDIAPAGELALASKVVQARVERTGERERNLWPWLVLAALGVICLEWWIYNRKVHV